MNLLLPTLLLLSCATALVAGIQKSGDFSEPSPQPPKHERIITDLNEAVAGVVVDFRYNDSSTFPPGEGLSSVPGCPKNENGYPWVLFQPLSLMSALSSRNKCFLVGQRGPCEIEQKIFVEPGSPFGYCNWDCFEGVERKGKQEMFCDKSFSNLRHVFFPDSKQRYTLYDQGPCKDGEWLVEIEDSEKLSFSSPLTKCERRQCPTAKLPKWTRDEQGNKLSFECVDPSVFITYAFAGSAGENGCAKDMQYSSLLKKCIKKFSFTF